MNSGVVGVRQSNQIHAIFLTERLLGSDALAAIVEDDGVVVAAGNQRRSVRGKIERINLVFVIAEEFRDGETPHGRLRQSHSLHLGSIQYAIGSVN